MRRLDGTINSMDTINRGLPLAGRGLTCAKEDSDLAGLFHLRNNRLGSSEAAAAAAPRVGGGARAEAAAGPGGRGGGGGGGAEAPRAALCQPCKDIPRF